MRLKLGTGGKPLAILPVKNKSAREAAMATFSIRIPNQLVSSLEAVAEETGYSRNEVITRFLRFALEQHAAESKKK